MEASKVNKTIDAAGRDDKNFSSVNDKNMIPQEVTETIENAESSSANSRMKPILRSWKGKGSNVRYSDSPIPDKLVTIERSNIFKPSLLSKSRKWLLIFH